MYYIYCYRIKELGIKLVIETNLYIYHVTYLPLSKLVPERKPARRDTNNTAEKMYKFVATAQSVG